MSKTVATSLPQEELAELDSLRRAQGLSRADTLRAAVQWYIGAADALALAEPTVDEIEP